MSRVLARNIVVKVVVAAGAAWLLGSAVGAVSIGAGTRR